MQFVHELSKLNCIHKRNAFYTCRNYTKTIICFKLSDYGEYSPRPRLGVYSPIITPPLANNC